MKKREDKKIERIGFYWGASFPIFLIILFIVIIPYAIYHQDLTNKSDFILFLTHPLVIIVLVSVGIAQFLKMVTTSIQEKRVTPLALLQIVGMPSTHMTVVISFLTGYYYIYGVDSLLISGIIIGIYMLEDILTTERGIDKNADILNRFTTILPKKVQERLRYRHQHSRLSHTGSEVLVGSILGIVIVKILLHFFLIV